MCVSRALIELIWAAGFWDGEGCCAVNGFNKPQLSICQKDRRALDRFVAAIGVGEVKGPYKNGKNGEFERYVVALSAERAYQTIDKLWLFIGAAKHEQIKRVFSRLQEDRRITSTCFKCLAP